MSTENKNTLFRFVSMRSPQLADEEKQNDRFIFREKNIPSGVFDIVKDKTFKWNELKQIAKTFTPLTIQEIKAVNAKLTELSIWIAKNRLSFDTNDLTQKMAGVNAITDLNVLSNLWDNLFYQTVTQSDFYAKERLLQLLQANHLVVKFNGDEVLTKTLVNAKVVLPKALFVEDNAIASESGVAKMMASEEVIKKTYPQEEMIKQQVIAQTEYENGRYQKLENELKAISKNFQKEYNSALSLAEKNHEDIVKPILEQYKNDLESAKKDWCAIKDPNVVYDPKDPCNQPPTVPTPIIPEFEFNFRDPLDLKELEARLTPESFEALLEITGKYSEVVDTNVKERLIQPSVLTLSDDYNDFNELTGYISSNIATNNEIISSNTSSSENTLVSVGGILIPLVIPVPTTLFGFQICSKPVSKTLMGSIARYNSDLSIAVPDDTWNVASFNYSLVRSDGNNYANHGQNTYALSRIGNTIFFKNMAIGLPLLAEESLLQSFSGEITFTNGVVKKFSIPEFKLSLCSSGTLITSLDEGDNGDDTQLGSGNESPFIPSGFGVKQLGIADYKKVEQSTQCYVEGDVAHIENIMAREYKEKATRRLRRSENTVTTSSETEREHLTDTSSTSRFDMQSEVAKVLQESKDFSAFANFNGSFKAFGSEIGFSTGVNYATHNSKEESTRQAVTQAKEITESALDRIVSKVKEERINKIVEEFEENNKHGFDNTKGDKHVVGVFRWVDKLFKNQIVNYGKRLMFEFMVPQPAKLHSLGMQENKQQMSLLIEPEDPRKALNNNLADYSKVTEVTLKHWAAKYNVEVTLAPATYLSIGKSFSFTTPETMGAEWEEVAAGNEEVKLPEGYNAIGVTADWYYPSEPGYGLAVIAGSKKLQSKGVYYPVSSFNGVIPISYSVMGHHSGSVNVEIKCELTSEARKKWQQETFKAIIDAYEDALTVYNEKLAEEKATGIQIKGTNPGFYREFENKILRKNCISYLIDQNPLAKNTYGKSNLFKIVGNATAVGNFGNTEVNLGKELDDYAAFVKFMEQAFEWDIMSYNLYPYYWGNRSEWATLYQYDDSNDPLFRNFMQAGMARVVVTVRPGFEEAVRYYMQTGQIWNGGEVPVIEDELFMSIVDELREPLGQKEGKAWITRVPTSLTILQADSIGLKVEKALPCNCDDVNSDTFEDPDAIPCNSNFVISNSQLNQEETKFIEFTFEGMDNRMFQTIGDHDADNNFPKIYECMGQTITINRDANWLSSTRSAVIFNELAKQLSLINGVTAKIAISNTGATDGITFTIDTSKIKDFVFTKPGDDPMFDTIRLIVEDDALVKIGKYDYIDARIQDKARVPLSLPSETNLFPISRFLI
ncbi:conserved hypothetical protein [Flavobacterium sp. 9AF]|uniref:hypothetical protein n=1 Tax=Flavobacterium sp. 9AF TaxID=2653142 RepID=UPI0012EFB5A1|nr:hypothetical protein [Flavobacterium sp. 9AF]VXB82613.1 conserved hypothetical protein [Flavobacterium sp. 9AF]